MNRYVLVSALLIFAWGSDPATGDTAPGELERAELISDELERLRSLPAIEQVGDARRERVDQQLELLDHLEAEIGSGRVSWAIAQLEGPFVDLAILEYSATRSLDGEDGLEFVRAEFEALGKQLDQAESRIFSNGLEQLPMAYRALVEAVWQQAEPTRAAAMAYGEALNFASGVYYLAKADANARYALFLRTLEGVARPAPQVPSVASALADLDREVIETYDPASAGDYGVYGPHVQLNVAIKEARELDAAGRRVGSLYQYLVARMYFALLRSTEDSALGGDLLAELASWTKRLDDSKLDHGVAVIFLEAAASVLAAPQPSVAGEQRARVILKTVLPEYFRLIEDPTS